MDATIHGLFYKIALHKLSDSAYRSDTTKFVPTPGYSTMVYASGWHLLFLQHFAKRFCQVWSGGEPIYLEGSWCVLVPPKTVINARMGFRPYVLRSVVSRRPLREKNPEKAYAMPYEGPIPQTDAQVQQLADEIGTSTEISFAKVIHPVARKLKTLMDDSDDEMPPISELATTLGCPRTFLARVFKQSYGLSPSEYLIRLKIMQSLDHLVFRQQSIAEVSRLCGFNSVNSFNKTFRKTLRMAPSSFQVAKRNPLWGQVLTNYPA